MENIRECDKRRTKKMKVNQHCATEAHELLKNTSETAKTTIGKFQMAGNFLEHLQMR